MGPPFLLMISSEHMEVAVVTQRDSKVSLHPFHYTTTLQPTFLLFSFPSSLSCSWLSSFRSLTKRRHWSNKILVSLWSKV